MRKSIVPAVLVVILLTGCETQNEFKADLSGKKILIVVPPVNFREEELFTPMEVFEDSGADVVLASSAERAVGYRGTALNMDTNLSDVKVDEYDAIVFVDGIGVSKFADDSKVLEIIREANSKGKIVAAITIAPVLLGEAGILSGKNATCWPEWQVMMRRYGANLEYSSVVRDGNIITAFGPTASREFAQEIARALATHPS